MKSRRLLVAFGLGGLLVTLALGPLALLTPPAVQASDETFLVNTAKDDPDSNIGNCVCRTAGGTCTLRAAIQEANACAGPQTIRFSGQWLIIPTTALPVMTDDRTVIDGSDQWKSSGGNEWPGVSLDGSGAAFSGLEITASRCAVYGLSIEGFGHHSLYLHGSAQYNSIGSTGPYKRNIISRNRQYGVRIEGATSTSNFVEGNYIGTSPIGTEIWLPASDWGNGWHGVSVSQGADNWVGYNLVAGNGWSGVALDYVGRGVVVHNRIGMAVDGKPLGNSYYGIHVAHGSTPQISDNEIAFNRRGIHVEGNSEPNIFFNTIYQNNASTLVTAPGRGAGIYCACGARRPLIHGNVITNNIAYTGTDSWGYGGGLFLCNGATLYYNTVISNTANTAGEGYGGGLYLTESDAIVSGNTIMNNTAGVDFNSRGGGLGLHGSNATVINNAILWNVAAVPNRGFGGGLLLSYSNAKVDGNLIAGNSASHGGGLNTMNSASYTATNNIITQNRNGGGVEIWATEPSSGLLLNNTIAHNSGSGIYLDNTDLELYDSIVASNTAYGLYLANGWSLTNDRNDVWGNSSGPSNEGLSLFLQADPLFFGAGSYALRAGSPCIDAGSLRLSTSYNGLPRPQGHGNDLGAYEMAPPTCLPLIRLDIHP